MDVLCHRFPHVAKMILNNLDDQSLIQIMDANKEVDDFLSNDRIYWIRVTETGLNSYGSNVMSYHSQFLQS